MTGSQIRERLRSGERVYGTQIAGLMTPTAAARSAALPLDFAFFCTEHMPLDPSEVSLLCQFYAAYGISPIVRVPGPDATAVTRALDAGAQGIVVPYVETVEEVRRMAGAVRFRPIKGRLLAEAISGERVLPPDTQAFLREFNREHYLIIGIESVPAIQNLETLLDAAEVDAVFLGPHDISVSMGIAGEYDNPDFLAAIEDVIRRCRARHVGVGLHIQLGRLEESVLQRLFDAGMNFVINGAEIVSMLDGMRAELNRLREIAGDAPATDVQGRERAGAIASQACVA